MKRLKNIVIVFFLISHGYYLGNPFENCFPCSYFFGGGDTSKNDHSSSDYEEESSELNSPDNEESKVCICNDLWKYETEGDTKKIICLQNTA